MNHNLSLILALALCLLSPLASPTIAAPDDNSCFRPGVHLSKEHPLTDKQIKILLEGLRFWTSFNEIGFDTAGNLTLGNRGHITSGSTTARDLIIAAIDSHDSFTIENRDHSPAIAFARVQADLDCRDKSGLGRHGWQIQVDFSDFNELKGDHYVLSAFDPAINVLHELVHSLLGYPDALDAREVGQCEGYVNRIRAELGLPQRRRYYARSKVIVPGDFWTKVALGELVFVDSGAVAKKKQERSLLFNLKGVVNVRKAVNADQ